LSSGDASLNIKAAFIAQTVSTGQPGRFTILGSSGDTVPLLNTTDATWQSKAITETINSMT
jgi:hypothetical protein